MEFASELSVSPERAWAWATSLAGIARELRPWMRMTAPPHVKSLIDAGDHGVTLGRPLFRSYYLLLGCVPVDRVQMTLLELEPGRRFVEQSPMLSMRLWRHERTITQTAGGCEVRDRLEFEPRFAGALTSRIVHMLFTHRHRTLRAALS